MKKKEVLKDINFEFEKGKIYGLLGRNGAGKTTFFNCLNEDIDINEGEFYIEDNNQKRKMAVILDYTTWLFNAILLLHFSIWNICVNVHKIHTEKTIQNA